MDLIRSIALNKGPSRALIDVISASGRQYSVTSTDEDHKPITLSA